MRHYSPRQRQSDGRWDYCCGDRPVGYCHTYKPFDENDTFLHESQREQENAKAAPHVHKFHTDGHETEEEACECYKQYLLDFNLYLHPEQENPSQLLKCQVCGEFCSGSAQVGGYRYFQLCPEHCNREEVEKLLTIGESWES